MDSWNCLGYDPGTWRKVFSSKNENWFWGGLEAEIRFTVNVRKEDLPSVYEQVLLGEFSVRCFLITLSYDWIAKGTISNSSSVRFDIGYFNLWILHIVFCFCTSAMGLQTTQWPSHGAFLLKSWLLISLGLCSQVSKLLACPSVCRCDRNFVYCNERSLTSVPLGIPEGVTVLYLHNNQINNAGFPAELHNVQSVHTVYLYGNQLDEFPMNLPKNVRVLHLQENNIQTISRVALAQLLKLEELHLDDNSISTVGVEDGAFREAISLKLLFLSKNHLSSVPVGLPVDLQELRVDENRIAVISDMAFQNLTSLERLIVDGNLLTNKGIAEGTFSHLTKLKEFSMVRNSLSHPPPDLPGTHLLRLYLQDNQINHIPLTAFAHLRKLERLDISNNQLRVLTQGVFDNLSNLKQLTARNNPWFCDCSIKWVTEWLKYIPSSLNVRGFMCQGPEQSSRGHRAGAHRQRGEAAFEPGKLEPRSTYRICLVPLDAFNYRAVEDTVCSEVTTHASYLNNGSNTASSHEQTTPHSLGSPFLLAGLIGGAVIFVLVVLLSVFCWHMHKKGRYTSQKWKYNRGRRKDDYCEAGTKKDNSILEMTETSFQIVSLNNDQLLKGDFRLQPIYTPNGGISYTDCHIPNNMRYCNSSVPDLEHCHT
ncbi:hypothetical protein QTO34_020095 [Cnephaeus nilssonii]|uniref:LRRNT domain-containing protein n=1 Tax=Cnephaeus nilssonii TaxID=3371016 RepID=A0AA40HXZ8_CNENI|nr:hypothetical protein QTO34_020095 [Eptesicus nilssonii]